MKIIRIKGCKECPNCYRVYEGRFKCLALDKDIGNIWKIPDGVDELFPDLPDDAILYDCPLEEAKE